MGESLRFMASVGVSANFDESWQQDSGPDDPIHSSPGAHEGGSYIPLQKNAFRVVFAGENNLDLVFSVHTSPPNLTCLISGGQNYAYIYSLHR